MDDAGHAVHGSSALRVFGLPAGVTTTPGASGTMFSAIPFRASPGSGTSMKRKPRARSSSQIVSTAPSGLSMVNVVGGELAAVSFMGGALGGIFQP